MSAPAHSVPEVRVREWAGPLDSQAFKAINEGWITAYFALEAKDLDVLEDPEGAILNRGGRIFIAEANGVAVGCTALIPLPDGGFEVAKMGVAPQARGQGAGRALMEACVATAQRLGAPRLYLETNSRLAPAIALYEAAGFVHLADRRSPYARADVFMERVFSD